jgi:hypothetical protein
MCILRPVLVSGRFIVGPNSAWLFSSSRSVLSPSVSSLGFKCLTGNFAYRQILARISFDCDDVNAIFNSKEIT